MHSVTSPFSTHAHAKKHAANGALHPALSHAGRPPGPGRAGGGAGERKREERAGKVSRQRRRPVFLNLSPHTHTQLAPAPASAPAPPRPGFKVALLGAAGGIGQPLGMLLKM